MASDSLSKAGLYFDELNKIRVLEPDAAQQTGNLKEECKDFVDKMGEFSGIAAGLIAIVDKLSVQVENEKMKAIGARNLLTSVSKEREAKQQQLQALVGEKQMELERLRVEFDSLIRIQNEQQDFIDQLLLTK